MNTNQATQKIAIGDCVSFIVERAPRGGIKSGKRHAGYVRAIRNSFYGPRVTVEDENGYRYTVDENRCRK